MAQARGYSVVSKVWVSFGFHAWASHVLNPEADAMVHISHWLNQHTDAAGSGMCKGKGLSDATQPSHSPKTNSVLYVLSLQPLSALICLQLVLKGHICAPRCWTPGTIWNVRYVEVGLGSRPCEATRSLNVGSISGS